MESVSNEITYDKSGRLVRVVLADETGKICAKIFRHQIEVHVPLLKENARVRIEKFTVQDAYKVEDVGHKYEIVPGDSTRITTLVEASPRHVNENGSELTKISDIRHKTPNDKVTVLGMLANNRERCQMEYRMVTNIHLWDETGHEIRCALWGNLVRFNLFYL